MIVIVHLDNDAEKTADFGHERQLLEHADH
jgi:hypothetical protein